MQLLTYILCYCLCIMYYSFYQVALPVCLNNVVNKETITTVMFCVRFVPTFF